MRKLRVGILFGGQSAEHEISLQSAKNIFEAIDKDRYTPVLIGIDKTGKWLLAKESGLLIDGGNPRLIARNDSGRPLSLAPGNEGTLTGSGQSETQDGIDLAFPVLHGPMGEDGTIQGLLKLAGIPFVGSGVLGSAVGMDKDVMKRLLRDAGIPVARFVSVDFDADLPGFDEIAGNLGLPFFVKPANMGSSVGVHKVSNQIQYRAAIEDAFQFDNKILIEENVHGREIECAVLGNREPIASAVGEIVPNHDFYSYEAKYIDENGARLDIPAKLTPEEQTRAQEIAVKTFRVLGAHGLARVDMFLTKKGKILVNEINTMPGFTKISMYPKLWEYSGIGYTELISRLIQLSVERFDREKRLKTSYT